MIISMSEDDQDDQFYARPRRKNAGYDYEKHRQARAKVWDRIKDIIEENNANNMDSRGVAYIGSGLKSKFKARDLPTKIQDPHSDLVYRVELGRGSGLVGARKKRSDAGKPRKPSDWQLLVKAVAAYEGIPYNKALKVASQYKKEGYTYHDFD